MERQLRSQLKQKDQALRLGHQTGEASRAGGAGGGHRREDSFQSEDMSEPLSSHSSRSTHTALSHKRLSHKGGPQRGTAEGGGGLSLQGHGSAGGAKGGSEGGGEGGGSSTTGDTGETDLFGDEEDTETSFVVPSSSSSSGVDSGIGGTSGSIGSGGVVADRELEIEAADDDHPLHGMLGSAGGGAGGGGGSETKVPSGSLTARRVGPLVGPSSIRVRYRRRLLMRRLRRL